MYYMIDNEDSFVYNLVAYFKELGCNISVTKADDVKLESLHNENIHAIIISSGPGKPEDAIIPQIVIEKFGNKIPILGVCLGQQVLAHAKGG